MRLLPINIVDISVYGCRTVSNLSVKKRFLVAISTLITDWSCILGKNAFGKSIHSKLE
jgi:hypothetical protein